MTDLILVLEAEVPELWEGPFWWQRIIRKALVVAGELTTSAAQ